MTDEPEKTHLLERHRQARESIVDKLEGLNEYDVRRPMSRTGTNLLGLVKHLTLYEAAYFGAVFGRPYPEQPLPALDGRFHNRDYMWVNEQEPRSDVMAAYQRACTHADVTIETLPIDAPGHVPWWRSDVTLFNVLVHMLIETNRHLGHADMIREEIDGAVGESSVPPTANEEADWAAHRSLIERAARAAQQNT